MAVVAEDREFQQRMERIEALLAEAKRFADPKARAQVQAIVQGLLDLHAVALEKILDAIADQGELGVTMIDALARDDLVGSVFLLYGLHPLDVEARVRQALDEIRPFLSSHGGEVELLRVAGGAVRLRLHGSCDNCPSSVQSLKSAVEEAIYNKAPDVTGVDIEGLTAANGHYESDGHPRFALPLV